MRRTTGPTISGRLFRLDDESLVVTTADGRHRRLPRADVVSIEGNRSGRNGDDGRPLVLMTNGDSLVGRPIAAGDENLTVEWPGTNERSSVPLPLEFVASVVVHQPDDRTQRDRARRQWGLLRPDVDRVLLRNGSTVEGELAGFDTDALQIETTLGMVDTSRDEVAAILLNAELSAKPRPLREFAIVSFDDGSRLTLQELHVDGDGVLYGRAVVGVLFKIPLDRVTRIQFFSEQIASLTELEPTRYHFTPFWGEEYPLVAHRNVCGGPLKLRGRTYAVGLGMHSQSEATYDLPERGYRTFSATIGIDDCSAGGGQAVFAVEIDGERVYDSGNVRGVSEPIRVGPIDVSGARELTLVVEFGGRANILDVADWCDPLLLK